MKEKNFVLQLCKQNGVYLQSQNEFNPALIFSFISRQV